MVCRIFCFHVNRCPTLRRRGLCHCIVSMQVVGLARFLGATKVPDKSVEKSVPNGLPMGSGVSEPFAGAAIYGQDGARWLHHHCTPHWPMTAYNQALLCFVHRALRTLKSESVAPSIPTAPQRDSGPQLTPIDPN